MESNNKNNNNDPGGSFLRSANIFLFIIEQIFALFEKDRTLKDIFGRRN